MKSRRSSAPGTEALFSEVSSVQNSLLADHADHSKSSLNVSISRRSMKKMNSFADGSRLMTHNLTPGKSLQQDHRRSLLETSPAYRAAAVGEDRTRATTEPLPPPIIGRHDHSLAGPEMRRNLAMKAALAASLRSEELQASFIVTQRHRITSTRRFLTVDFHTKTVTVHHATKRRFEKRYGCQSYVQMEEIEPSTVILRIQEGNSKKPKKYTFQSGSQRDLFCSIIRGLQSFGAPSRQMYNSFISAQESSGNPHATVPLKELKVHMARNLDTMEEDPVLDSMVQWAQQMLCPDETSPFEFNYVQFSILFFRLSCRSKNLTNFLAIWMKAATHGHRGNSFAEKAAVKKAMAKRKSFHSAFAMGQVTLLAGETAWTETLEVAQVLTSSGGVKTSVQGGLYATNYRLIFVCFPPTSLLEEADMVALSEEPAKRISTVRKESLDRDSKGIVSLERGKADKGGTLHVNRVNEIPLMTILKVEMGANANILKFVCKDMRTVKLVFSKKKEWVTSFLDMLKKHIFIQKFDPSSCFAGLHRSALDLQKKSMDCADGWTLLNWAKEFYRQGVFDDPKTLRNKRWKVVDNTDFKLCPNYPRTFVVPSGMSAAELLKVSMFRSSARIPALCWVHPISGRTLSRCSQPRSGVLSSREKTDEKIVNLLRLVDDDDREQGLKNCLVVLDCRAYIAAVGNKMKGKGMESIKHYGAGVSLEFCDIGNIHTMRTSVDALQALVHPKSMSDENTTFLSRLEATDWLKWSSYLLRSAVRIADLMEGQNTSVMIHCSDGWDRTPQVSCLSQMIMDPYFRTLEGFAVLVEKEWLAFGHQFRIRLLHGDCPKATERSPCFLQFLDCVWQIHRQFPTAFEFNEAFLMVVADEMYSCRFGTFLDNTDRERVQLRRDKTTESLWTYMFHPGEKNRFLNAQYHRCERTIWPSSNAKRLVLWEAYYLRWDPSLWPVAPSD
jgi:myotubularin-related protein 1/2